CGDERCNACRRVAVQLDGQNLQPTEKIEQLAQLDVDGVVWGYEFIRYMTIALEGDKNASARQAPGIAPVLQAQQVFVRQVVIAQDGKHQHDGCSRGCVRVPCTSSSAGIECIDTLVHRMSKGFKMRSEDARQSGGRRQA